MKKFAVLGGDKRNIYLAGLLEADGHFVKRFGFSSYEGERIAQSDTLADAISDADYVICPIPCSNDCINLNAPFNKSNIKMEEIFKLMSKEQILMAGFIKNEVTDLAKKYEIKYKDILKLEKLAVLNAIPTAEGAIKIAIENTSFTLHGSKIMVIGYGRIGKILCKMLDGMGAKVFAVDKESKDLALAQSCGYTAVFVDDIPQYLGEMSIIFNTVPTKVIDESNAANINEGCLLVDLASPPYGIDFRAVKNAGLKVIYSGSLPGIIAPLTVASYIKETIYSLINDWRNSICNWTN